MKYVIVTILCEECWDFHHLHVRICVEHTQSGFQRKILALHVLQARGLGNSFTFHKRMSSLYSAWFTEPPLINITINIQVLAQERHCGRVASHPTNLHSLPQGSSITRHGQRLSLSAFPPSTLLHLHRAWLYVPLLSWNGWVAAPSSTCLSFPVCWPGGEPESVWSPGLWVTLWRKAAYPSGIPVWTLHNQKYTHGKPLRFWSL